MTENNQACERCGGERFVLRGPKPNPFYYDAPLFLICIDCGLVNPPPPARKPKPARPRPSKKASFAA